MPPVATVFLRSVVKQLTGTPRRPRYPGRYPGRPGPPGGTDENATVGFLVVPVRGLGTFPGKIPQATARLTPRNRSEARAHSSRHSNPQALNAPRGAGARMTRSCAAVATPGPRKSSKSIGLY